MGDEEQWSLGTAVAIVNRSTQTLRVRLQGVVTAMVFEALLQRLAGERAVRRELVLDHDAMLVMTCRSAVDAALRGTPADGAEMLYVGVPCTKLAWALEHCLLMTREGQPRLPFVLERWPPAMVAG